MKKVLGFLEVVSLIVEYFLEKESVELFIKNNRELATLKTGTCFGESTLIRGKKHNNSAFTLENCLVRTVNEEIIEKNLRSDEPLFQLVVYLVLRLWNL